MFSAMFYKNLKGRFRRRETGRKSGLREKLFSKWKWLLVGTFLLNLAIFSAGVSVIYKIGQGGLFSAENAASGGLSPVDEAKLEKAVNYLNLKKEQKNKISSEIPTPDPSI